jgi:hypothetical protein
MSNQDNVPANAINVTATNSDATTNRTKEKVFSTNIESISDRKKRNDRRSYHKYSLYRRAALCYLQHGTHVIIWYLTETGNWAAFSTHGRPIEATLIMFQAIDEMQQCGNLELNIDIDDQWETFYEEQKGYAQLLDALSALETLGVPSEVLKATEEAYQVALQKRALAPFGSKDQGKYHDSSFVSYTF